MSGQYFSMLGYEESFLRLITASGSAPTTPTGFSAVGGGGNVVLNWSSVPGATSYNIYRSTTPSGETLYTSSGTNTYTDSSVVAGTPYYYQVTAVNSHGESSRTTEQSGTPTTAALFVADGTGNLWQVTTGGVASSYALAGSSPAGCVKGPDGNIWVPDNSLSGVWRVSQDGSSKTFFALAGSNIQGGICVGADSNLWVTDFNGAIWRVTTSGTATKFTANDGVPYGNALLRSCCLGGDNRVWATDDNGHFIWAFDTTGTGTKYGIGYGTSISGIVPVGSQLWIADNAGSIWTIATTGSGATQYSIASFNPSDICVGPDSLFWCPDENHNLIWQINPGVSQNSYTGGGSPIAICLGPDNNLWVTGTDAPQINGYVWKTLTNGSYTQYAIGTAFPEHICSN